MTKILLVEDNEMNRDMLSRRLIKKGFEVEMAVDGEEGYSKGKSSDYTIILMDMSLPKMDGWEITQKLRADGIKTPIIALTAHALESDKKKCMDAGCDEFETKPVELPRLLEKINKFIQN
jgi:two-component system cell cycle response regulator DivK